ncbi:MAG: hypothetical protein AAB116_06580 [Candidatus Poribacteria bacterium]
MSVLANNTVITNLALVNRLDLLEKLFGNVYISSEVYQEIEDGIEYGYNFLYRTKQIIDEEKWLSVINMETPEIKIFSELTKFLHLGEASCIAIAQKRKWLFLTDDNDARNYALKFSIALSGTIGVLRDSVYADFITLDEGEKYHQTMVEYGYRSPIKRLKDALK